MLIAEKVRFFLFVCQLVGIVLSVAPLSFAQTGTNYRIWTDVLAGGGGESSSASYRSFSTLGQPTPIGPSHSTGYYEYPGFIYPLLFGHAVLPIIDFNGDGKPDILWRNLSTGRTTVWYMDGATWTGGYSDILPTVSGPEWAIVGVADFNHDGQPDLLWRNATTGRATIWYINEATWTGEYADVLPPVIGSEWAIVGVADFNNDSKPDLLWRNASTGRTTVWYMDGTVWNGGYADVEPTVADPNWSIVGIADFNGDRKPDLLWRDVSSGRTTIWYMNGSRWNGGYADVMPTVSGSEWAIVGVADFNADRKPDLLWRNATTGRTAIWYMDGPNWNGQYADVLPTVTEPDWIIVGK
jgi:hypothetical protein